MFPPTHHTVTIIISHSIRNTYTLSSGKKHRIRSRCYHTSQSRTTSFSPISMFCNLWTKEKCNRHQFILCTIMRKRKRVRCKYLKIPIIWHSKQGNAGRHSRQPPFPQSQACSWHLSLHLFTTLSNIPFPFASTKVSFFAQNLIPERSEPC